MEKCKFYKWDLVLWNNITPRRCNRSATYNSYLHSIGLTGVQILLMALNNRLRNPKSPYIINFLIFSNIFTDQLRNIYNKYKRSNICGNL